MKQQWHCDCDCDELESKKSEREGGGKFLYVVRIVNICMV